MNGLRAASPLPDASTVFCLDKLDRLDKPLLARVFLVQNAFRASGQTGQSKLDGGG